MLARILVIPFPTRILIHDGKPLSVQGDNVAVLRTDRRVSQQKIPIQERKRFRLVFERITGRVDFGFVHRINHRVYLRRLIPANIRNRSSVHSQQSAEAKKLKEEADQRLANAQAQSANIIFSANQQSEKILQDAQRREQLIQTNSETHLREAKLESERIIESAKNSYEDIVAPTREKAQKIVEESESCLNEAKSEADRIIESAKNSYEDIVAPAREKAQESLDKSIRLQTVITALENKIKGYGNEWIIPGVDVLDELADELAHTEAGAKLKDLKAKIKDAIADGDAAICDYAEAIRRETACLFVIDAFNGKVDSIIARVKHDNYGKLAQEMKDAFALVNQNGQAFRNARITKPFLDMRLEQLKWAVAAHELRLQAKEEQSRIRAQMRDEEKARKEAEKARKEAEKEEANLQKAMEKARLEMEKQLEEQRRLLEEASADQREELERLAAQQKDAYQQQLEELNAKLKEAEEKNQRAISMAQQTKRGTVYVISNVGSFGENIYKIGMTRRLEPQDRVDELGDASVPFRFDVHAFIKTDDAPALETALHKKFVLGQVNKVNHRREFFRATLTEIREEIEKMGLDAAWTMAAAAREYQETLAIERDFETNPDSKMAWVNRQYRLDDTDQLANYASSEDDGDELGDE